VKNGGMGERKRGGKQSFRQSEGGEKESRGGKNGKLWGINFEGGVWGTARAKERVKVQRNCTTKQRKKGCNG